MAAATHEIGKVSQFLEEARLTHHFSGYQLYARCGKQVLNLAGGEETGWSGGAAVTPSTVFDLGSLTKVIATTSLVARYVESGRLTVADTLDRFLEGLSPRWAKVTLHQLLTHTSGARGWCAYFETRTGGETFIQWFLRYQNELADAPVGQKIIYSDIGFSLLGEVLRDIDEKPLDVLFQDEVARPLLLSGIGYGPVKNQVAATEFCLWRNRLLHGEVFDANTFAMGGVAAQAGLFGSAEGLAPFCQAWLDAADGKSPWLTASLANEFIQPAVRLEGRSYGVGWDLPAEKGSSAGEKLSRKSFGHLGYTGTSLWIDPERKGFVIFLTNRVHPSRLDERIRAVRPALHNLVVEHWESANG